ncbi:MAG TPA: flavodoxin family protein [Candidatus Bathyarchaeia archaeon]|nr:flavodoxin family protein [Candidatus Bathyarchaeia archaeon]
MKTLGVNSSPRRKNSRTLKLVQAVLDGARTQGAEIEMVDVCALNINYCIGCQVCFAKGECVQDDDLAEFVDKMLGADGIVLGSPVYMHGVTAQLKTVIDRLADAIYCQKLAGKYGCAVTTSGGSADAHVLDYMNHFLNELGAVTVGKVGVALDRDSDALEAGINKAFKLGMSLAESICTKRAFPAQEKKIAQRRMYFTQLIRANKAERSHQYEYWMDKGWI